MSTYLFNGEEINIGETWEAPYGNNYGIVIGFNSKGVPVIEEQSGNINLLQNTSWQKRVPKVKAYIYYNRLTNRLLVSTLESEYQDWKLLEIREYNQGDLK